MSFRALVVLGAAWAAVSLARGACPLPNPADCIYVDVAACGLCGDGTSTCTSDAECTGLCSGTCDDQTTPCRGDADCAGIFSGFCSGSCVSGGMLCGQDADCAGSCSGATAGNGSQAQPFCRIQQAYDAASAGDTLLVRPGTYAECVAAWGFLALPAEDKPVRLVADAWLSGRDNLGTIIDGTAVCADLPTVTIGGSGAALEGFTVQGGRQSGVYTQGSVTITHNRITGNSSGLGGGIFVYPGTCYYPGDEVANITDNFVLNNTAAAGPVGTPGVSAGDGGGVYVVVGEFSQGCLGGGSEVNVSGNTIADNTIANANTDPSSGLPFTVLGGGLWVLTQTFPGSSATVRVTQNTITGNGPAPGSASYGGGIFAATAGSGQETIEIKNNTVGPDNLATRDGGGISAWVLGSQTGRLSIAAEGNDVSGNEAQGLDLFFQEHGGGGLDLFMSASDFGAGDRAVLRVAGNRIAGNTSGLDGGGVLAQFVSRRSIEAGDPFPAHPDPADELSFAITDNTITGNTAALGAGGALLSLLADSDPASLPPFCDVILPAAARIDFDGNLVARNTANNFLQLDEVGGGVLTVLDTVGEALAAVTFNVDTIAHNTIASGAVGGVELLTFKDPDCLDNVNGQPQATFDSSIIAGNGGYGVGATLTPASTTPDLLVRYCDAFDNAGGNYQPVLLPVDPTGQDGNVAVDPLFRDAASGDYHLETASPAIDRGNPAPQGFPPRDFEGDPRIFDGDGDGQAVVDMGYDESTCEPGAPFICDDDNVCTDDACDARTGCVNVPNTASCADDDLCDGSETCGGGTCQPGTPLDCDDGDPCTDDGCDAEHGCQHTGVCCDVLQPETLGFYQERCKLDGAPEPLTEADVDCINDSCTFSTVTAVADICGVLDPAPHDRCEQAAAQLMTLLLNLCRGRICSENPLNHSHCAGPNHATIGESAADADVLLCAAPPPIEQCARAHCEAKEINVGGALLRKVRKPAMPSVRAAK